MKTILAVGRIYPQDMNGDRKIIVDDGDRQFIDLVDKNGNTVLPW